MEAEVGIHRLLVVTFTVSATGELRHRIRAHVAGCLGRLYSRRRTSTQAQALARALARARHRQRRRRGAAHAGGTRPRSRQHPYHPRSLPAAADRVCLRWSDSVRLRGEWETTQRPWPRPCATFGDGALALDAACSILGVRSEPTLHRRPPSPTGCKSCIQSRIADSRRRGNRLRSRRFVRGKARRLAGRVRRRARGLAGTRRCLSGSLDNVALVPEQRVETGTGVRQRPASVRGGRCTTVALRRGRLLRWQLACRHPLETTAADVAGKPLAGVLRPAWRGRGGIGANLR